MDKSDEVMTGTTLLAFKFKDGVIVAADSRTSIGSFVASRITDKLTQITPSIFCCRSGSEADTQIIARNTQREIKLMSEMDGQKPSIEKTAKIISKIVYENREHFVASILVAGYVDYPQVFKIYTCGSLIESDIALGGSGSAFIYGFCDTHYRSDMSLEESIAFARAAITLAIKRDNSSGGVIRIAAIRKDDVLRYFITGDKVYT